MNEITHRQAKRYIRADLDGLLSDAQRRNLQTHLAGCEACRAESQSLSSLASRLPAEFHSRWDAQDGPSERLLKNIQSKSRRIVMQKRIDQAFNLLGGVAALIVLVFVTASVIKNFVATNGTQTNVPAAAISEKRLLAFTYQQDGNYEIYTVQSDGSDRKNITNNPADDLYPFWSPDGKRIAFQSDRNSSNGNYSQIFLMDTDGSNVVLLTTDKSDHELPLNTHGNTNPWSPDGSKLLYLRHGLSEKEWILQYIDVNTGEATSLVNGEFSLNDVSWSPDGKHIGFVLHALPDYNKPQLHIVSADGTQLINVSDLLPANEIFQNYDNVNSRAWSRDGQSFVFVASDAFAENRNSENQTWKIYKISMDGTLAVQTSTRSPIFSWWNGSYLVIPIMGPGGWTWVHPDGSMNTINPTKECEQERLYHPEDNSYTSAVANFSQSPNGNGIIFASCPDGTIQLSWVNSTGTQVLSIAKLSAAPGQYVDWTLWSQDDSFFAFHSNVSNTNDIEVYIVNIADALKNPSLPLVKISFGKSDDILVSPPAWQPIP